MVRERKRLLEVYCFPGCSLPHTAGLALGSPTHSFPVLGSRAFSVSCETRLAAMLHEAIGCSRQGDVWLGIGESLQRVCVGRKVLALWAFPVGPKPNSLGSGWAVEGSRSLPAQYSELCSMMGT